MKNQTPYSDEHINAYIDGELDNDERARLLFDEQHDTDLAQRISDARALKEKVQLAYASADPNNLQQVASEKSVCYTAFAGSPRFLISSAAAIAIVIVIVFPVLMSSSYDINAAKLLIKNTQTITPDKINAAIGYNTKVVINLSRYQPENFDSTIDSLEALLLEHIADEDFSVELVANKDGLKALDTKTSIHADRISLLAKRYDNLDIIACAKSMTNLADSGNPINLMKDILVSPSAAEQVAKRMSDGWMFIKL